ncbi:MAG TPA: rod shape-determining protein MreD [Chitinophagaceae bacterium]|nr:rod shape-determining protein MreD [Chitinophagaceae bacterium]
MSDLVKHSFRFIFFILLQALVLHRIPFLHKFITPYLYYLFIIWLPFNTKRGWLMFVAFIFGLTLDYFLNTPGLHAAACTLIAYVRPFLVNLLISQQGAEQNYASPSIRSMGWAPYFTLVLILTVLHHTYLVFLEWLEIGSFLYFIIKVLATTGISLLLILLAEMLFVRKEKFRTNTA